MSTGRANLPVALYVRVSRRGDREDERFHSPREQAERAAGLARAKGFEVGPTFEDIDVSGAKRPEDRPAMGELLAALDRGELGGIAAFSLDRLSREPAHGDSLVKRVTKAGGVILTPDIPDAIDTPTGEFTFGMLLQVAKLYRSQAKARFASATERAIVAGIPVGRTALGYRRRDDRKIEVDPDTAPLVREIYERRASGAGWYALTDLLTERTGRRWTVSGARELIRNELYMTGRLAHGELTSEWEAGALVDEATWHAAQRRGEPQTKPSRSEGRYLLSGLARCAHCGYALNPGHNGHHRRNSKGEVVEQRLRRRYKCRNRTCTERASIMADPLERYVLLQTFTMAHELATRSAAPDLGALEDAVATAERRLQQVLAPDARDALGDLWAADVKARRDEQDAALVQLGEARQNAGVPALAFHLQDAWAELTPTERRDTIALFWKEVRVAQKENGKQRVKLIARGPGGTAEVDL